MGNVTWHGAKYYMGNHGEDCGLCYFSTVQDNYAANQTHAKLYSYSVQVHVNSISDIASISYFSLGTVGVISVHLVTASKLTISQALDVYNSAVIWAIAEHDTIPTNIRLACMLYNYELLLTISHIRTA